MPKHIVRRSVYRHPLAALGAALFLAGGFLFFILLLIDLTGKSDNPYTSLVTFIGAPFIVTVGFALFLISIWRQVHIARKTGENVRFNLSIDPTDPRYRRNLWLFLSLSAVLIFLVAYSGTRAYEATDSVRFCGATCHTVMEPEYVAYQHSAHARVPCVECHIGPGASFYVRSKIDGLRQVIATLRNSYSRPIETPVENLRPAQQTCENCHWPRQFYGEKLVSKIFYRTDETNSPWSISLLVKIGGGSEHGFQRNGIHWHMLVENRIDYIATDRKRQVIPWVREISAQGDTTIYAEPGVDYPDPNDPNTEVRRLDCMDCHNRPSHTFLPPATAMNRAIQTHKISRELPYVREIGLDLLNAEYDTREQAHAAIDSGLSAYYNEHYPDLVDSLSKEIDSAKAALQEIYSLNFFPEMKTDYRARENNLSHFTNDGCFRCHDRVKKSADGRMIRADCKTCHFIVTQGPSEDPTSLPSDMNGQEFHHPEDIDKAWQEMKCTECHTPDSGY